MKLDGSYTFKVKVTALEVPAKAKIYFEANTGEKLLVDVWNYEAEIETRTVDTHMRRLREKLGDEAVWVETIRGVGYRMSDRRS